MSSFNADKKREHEALAEKALAAGDVAKAFFHTAQAAEFTFNLAEQSEGDVAKAYLADANELVAIAATLRDRAAAAKKVKTEKAAAKVQVDRETSGGKDGGGKDGAAPEKGKWTVTSAGDVLLDDVKGLADAKAVVMDALINPVNHPDVYKTLKVKPGTGLLLYGPPGTGKTMFAKAIANEMKTTFMHVKLNELKSKYVGETEQNIAAMFSEARSYKRCVLFLDECESMLRKRGSQKVCMVEQFLVELDGFKKGDGNQLFVLLATNRPWMLDSAITRSGRISTAVYVGLPEAETRRLIVDSALKDVPLSPDVDLDRLVELTDGFSGAEISHRENGGGVCDEARKFAARRWIERRKDQKEGSDEWKKVEPVTWEDFERALKTVVPTSRRDADIVQRNLAFRDSGESAGKGSGECSDEGAGGDSDAD